MIGSTLNDFAKTTLLKTLIQKAGTIPNGIDTANALAASIQSTLGVTATPVGSFVQIVAHDTAVLSVGQFASGLNVLGFGGSSNFQANVDYTLNLKAGLDGATFALDADHTDLTLGVNVPYSGNLTTFNGSLGAFNVQATPVGSGDALSLTYAIDPKGGIIDKGQPIPVDSTVFGSANVDLALSLHYKSAAGGLNPGLATEFLLSWPFGSSSSPSQTNAAPDQFGQSPTVTFKDVRLDLGSFLTSLAKPAADKVLELGQPVFAFTKYFGQKIPGLESIANQIHGLTGSIPAGVIPEVDQINAFLGDPTLSNVLSVGADVGVSLGKLTIDQRDEIKAILTAIKQVNDVAAFASDIQAQGDKAAAASTQIHFGDFVIGGPGENLRASGQSLKDVPVASSFDPSTPVNDQPGVDVLKTLTDKGLSVPLLSDPKQAFQILLGGKVTLIEYKQDIPVKGLDSTKYVLFNRNFLIGVVPANIQVNVTIPQFAFHLDFGIDTSGFVSGKPLDSVFIAAGSKNPVFNAEAHLNVEFAIGADVGVVTARAGVRGHIDAAANASFPSTTDDARLHLNDFSSDCPLEGVATVSAGVQTFAEAGLNFSLASLKQLVESLLASNPAIYGAQVLYDKLKAALGSLPPGYSKIIAIPQNFDPSKGLAAIDAALGNVGVKVSDTYKEAEKGVNHFVDETGKVINSGVKTVSDGYDKAKKAIFGLTGDGITIGTETHHDVYGPVVLFSWKTGQCGVTPVTSDASATGTAPPSNPSLGEQNGDVLTLHIGALGKLKRNVSPDVIDEVFSIRPADPANPGNGSVIVSAFGASQRFDGIKTIVGDAGDGNDTIDARGTGVAVNFIGGEGTDSLYAGLGRATLNGGNGNDSLFGGPADDTIFGGPDSDYIQGGAGNDTIDGGTGDDVIDGDFPSGSVQDDPLNPALFGNDVIVGGPGNNHIYGGPGNDTLTGGDDADEILGGAGQDVIDGKGGDDSLYGGAGNDTIHGGSGTDVIYGGSGNDVIDAGAIDDLTNDSIDGGSGNDVIYGTAGRNFIYGESGDDVIYGYGGDDVLSGDSGDDVIYGGDGNDLIAAGVGNDKLYGEGDDDTFIAFDLDVSLIGGPRLTTIDGGSGRNVMYAIGGSSIRTGVYTPDGGTSFAGNVAIANAQADTLGLNYINVQALSADTMDRFDLIDPRGGHALTISKPTLDPDGVAYGALAANQVSGTRSDPFASLNLSSLDFHDVPDVNVNTSANTDSTLGDAFTILSAGMIAQNLKNFSIMSGAGNDTLTINATDFRLPMSGGQFVFNSGSGRYVDGASASNLRGLISLDRIEVNADVDYLLADVGTLGPDGTPPEGRLSIAPTGSGAVANAARGSIRLIGVESAFLTGGGGNNLMDASGFSGSTILDGQGGNDTLIGGSGDNVLDGGEGNDILFAGDDRLARPGVGSQANVLLGGGGINRPRGGAGNDIFHADLGGTNILRGGVGNDIFHADLGGTATLVGGGGDDTFIITNSAGLVTAPVGGITIDGGGQSGDTLRLVGGGGPTYNQTYLLGPDGGQGQIVSTNNHNPTGPTISQFIRFTGLASIDDSLTADKLSVVGASTSAPIAGASGSDLAAGRMNLTVGGVPFAAIRFANKTTPSVFLANGQVVTAAAPVSQSLPGSSQAITVSIPATKPASIVASTQPDEGGTLSPAVPAARSVVAQPVASGGSLAAPDPSPVVGPNNRRAGAAKSHNLHPGLRHQGAAKAGRHAVVAHPKGPLGHGATAKPIRTAHRRPPTGK